MSAGRTGKNEMTQQDEAECEDDLSSSAYYGDGWQIVGYTCSRHFGPEWREEQTDDKGIVLPRGLYGKNGRLEWIMKMIVQGRGTRDISRTAHATGRTVRKYRDILKKLTGAKNELSASVRSFTCLLKYTSAAASTPQAVPPYGTWLKYISKI